MTRSRLIHAYFRAMRRFFSARTHHRAIQLRELATHLGQMLAERERPRRWDMEA